MKGWKTFLSELALATTMALTPIHSLNAQTNNNQEKSTIIFTDNNYNRPTGAQIRLYRVKPDGTDYKKIADSVQYYTNSSLHAASFSPDGTMITYATTNGKHKIIDLDGKVLHSFTGRSSTSRSDEDYAWTPDSKAILFGSYVDGLYKFDLEKDSIMTILKTIGYTYDHNPVMSPDMKKIAYTHHEYGEIYYNYVLDSAGKKLITSTYNINNPDTLLTRFDQQLDIKWTDNDNIIFNLASSRIGSGMDVIAYFNVNTATGKYMHLNTKDAFFSLQLSKDGKNMALVNPYGYLKLADVSSLNSDSLNITKTDIENASAMAYSSNSKIFCITDDGLFGNAYPYDRSESGLYAYDENMKRHIVLLKKNVADTIGEIQFIDWNSKPVTVDDLGQIDSLKYLHQLLGSAYSNLPKGIKDSTKIFLSKAPGDTLFAMTQYEGFNFHWKTANPSQEVTIGSNNVPGHLPNKEKFMIGKDTSIVIRFSGLKYTLEQPVHIQDKNFKDMNNVSIEGGDSKVITGIDGRTSVVEKDIITDYNNLPLQNYAIRLKLTTVNRQTLDTTIAAVAGLNPEVLLKFNIITAINDISLENKLKNYPNPFTNGTTIEYDLQGSTNVRLEVYDNLGNKVYDMAKKNEPTGLQHIQLDGSKMKSGIYYYKIYAGDKTMTGKIIKQ